MKRKTPSRREFITLSAAAGAAVLTGGTGCGGASGSAAGPAAPLPVPESGPAPGNAGKSAKRIFTILHTNDMHSAFIGVGPAADYTPFQLNDDATRGGYARLAGLIATTREGRKARGPVLLLDA